MDLKKRLLFRLLPDRRSFWQDAVKTLLILFASTAVNFLMVQTAREDVYKRQGTTLPIIEKSIRCWARKKTFASCATPLIKRGWL